MQYVILNHKGSKVNILQVRDIFSFGINSGLIDPDKFQLTSTREHSTAEDINIFQKNGQCL